MRYSLKRPFRFLLLIAILFSFSNLHAAEGGSEGENFDAGELIMHHVTDAYTWHWWDGAEIYLPIIVYSESRGLEMFSSANLFDHHEPVEYNGFMIDHGHLKMLDSDEKLWDFSITKNVASLLLNSLIVALIFLSVARGFKKNAGKAPKGIQSFFEPIIIYVRDEIVKPSIGPKYERYLPYMLSLFFFIWIGNMLGLTPGAANLTGNIAVTGTLAVFTLILTLFSANKHFWGHIFNPPVPLALKPIMVVIELIGIFTKPFALMIRLFVAITAGHIVILSLIALTFIFKSIFVGIGATFIVLFINIIELLVAAIQAYVFTLFSSMYIGMAMEEPH